MKKIILGMVTTTVLTTGALANETKKVEGWAVSLGAGQMTIGDNGDTKSSTMFALVKEVDSITGVKTKLGFEAHQMESNSFYNAILHIGYNVVPNVSLSGIIGYGALDMETDPDNIYTGVVFGGELGYRFNENHSLSARMLTGDLKSENDTSSVETNIDITTINYTYNF
jgi:opacity protein-like surface antigen